MFEKDEKAILEKIIALQKAYTSACREFSKLKARAKEKQSELGNSAVELKAALRDSRIGDKTLTNAENEIAVLKKKISEMDGDLEFVDQELKRTGDDAEKLSAQKSDLVEKLVAIKSRFQQAMDDLEKDEKGMQEIFSAVDARKVQKAGLTTEISKKLSTVAIEKEQGDKALDAFSMDFGRLAIEREDIRGTFKKREKVISDLRNETAALKEKCVSIKAVVALEKEKFLLETHVKKLEGETRISSENAKGLETALSQKEAELKLILSGKIEKEALVATLADEVEAFDELAEKAKASEDKLGEFDSRVEETISHLKKLFSGGVEYQQGFGLKSGLPS